MKDIMQYIIYFVKWKPTPFGVG